MSQTSEPVEAAADALLIAENTLSIAREAENEKAAALDEAKKAKEELVDLQKVASVHEQALKNITDCLRDAGWLDEDNYEKFASEILDSPDFAAATVKRILTFSASPYEEGQGIPKGASEDDEPSDPAAALRAAEEAAWKKVATEGA